MSKYEVILLNQYLPPSAIYRYGFDISNAIPHARLKTLIDNERGIISGYPESDFISGKFKRFKTLNKLFPNISYKTFINSVEKGKSDEYKKIIHYLSPMNQIKFSKFLKVVTIHDPISILHKTNLFQNGESMKSPTEFLKRKFQKRNYNLFKSYSNILCVSEYVKSILVTEGFTENIKVIYPAVPPEYSYLNNKLELRRKLNLPKDKSLILSVSSNLNRKNLSKVRKTLLLLGDDYKLVRVGKSIMQGDICFQDVSYEQMNEIYNVCSNSFFFIHNIFNVYKYRVTVKYCFCCQYQFLKFSILYWII